MSSKPHPKPLAKSLLPGGRAFVVKAAGRAIEALSISAPPQVITGEDLLRMVDELEQREEGSHE